MFFLLFSAVWRLFWRTLSLELYIALQHLFDVCKASIRRSIIIDDTCSSLLPTIIHYHWLLLYIRITLKRDWSRAFSQYTVTCELDMITQYLQQILGFIFFQEGTVTNPAIWLVISAGKILLSLPTSHGNAFVSFISRRDERTHDSFALQNDLNRCSCSPTVVNLKEKISSGIKGLEVLQKASIYSL